ncbi:Lrp/AsnC family transcriptional regulator [Chitinophaga nivalis]|uniref:Lrp/AsnC family transcriptional regulator n=1 Tax=Chitinophaga nivalis TaxID=2991709 RepID=A0ABT3IMS3_9BACT|nr:Lrp/AsnC family transcriptional regulator [Chitinophaga nivalis]MCW3465046.1 Lrp/AsnC family transcriptional regulator [Chitinophaga nivalis]MCW3485262.1 Lrp/AsnC family transcriptional regulator [Chitinophaga nivalis]
MKNESLADETDLQIIAALQKNARASFADIGRMVSLSPSAVRERILHLEDAGVIKRYQVEVDYRLLGLDIEAFILVKVYHGSLQTLIKKAAIWPEVLEANRIAGEHTVIVRTALKDRLHLQEFIDKISTYGDTVTLLILSAIEKKQV